MGLVQLTGSKIGGVVVDDKERSGASQRPSSPTSGTASTCTCQGLCCCDHQPGLSLPFTVRPYRGPSTAVDLAVTWKRLISDLESTSAHTHTQHIKPRRHRVQPDQDVQHYR